MSNPFPLVPSPCAFINSLFIVLVGSLQVLEGCDYVTPKSFFQVEKNDNSLYLSLYKRCSIPPLNLVVLLWTHSNWLMFFCGNGSLKRKSAMQFFKLWGKIHALKWYTSLVESFFHVDIKARTFQEWRFRLDKICTERTGCLKELNINTDCTNKSCRKKWCAFE